MSANILEVRDLKVSFTQDGKRSLAVKDRCDTQGVSVVAHEMLQAYALREV